MIEEPSSSPSDSPFSESIGEGSTVGEGAGFGKGVHSNRTDDGMSEVTLALSMAQQWVQEHQKTTMLGALAVGVFVGSLLRD